MKDQMIEDSVPIVLEKIIPIIETGAEHTEEPIILLPKDFPEIGKYTKEDQI